MDIYTKVFLINWVLTIFHTWILVGVFDIKKPEVPGWNLPCISFVVTGLWCALSLVSIPAWLIYLIVSW